MTNSCPIDPYEEALKLKSILRRGKTISRLEQFLTYYPDQCLPQYIEAVRKLVGERRLQEARILREIIVGVARSNSYVRRILLKNLLENYDEEARIIADMLGEKIKLIEIIETLQRVKKMLEKLEEKDRKIFSDKVEEARRLLAKTGDTSKTLVLLEEILREIEEKIRERELEEEYRREAENLARELYNRIGGAIGSKLSLDEVNKYFYHLCKSYPGLKSLLRRIIEGIDKSDRRLVELFIEEQGLRVFPYKTISTILYPDYTSMLSDLLENTMRVKEYWSREFKGTVRDIAWSPDTSLLAVAIGWSEGVRSYSQLVVLNQENNILWKTMVYEGYINSIAWSKDKIALGLGKKIIVLDSSGETLFELDTGRLINTLSWSPSGEYIAAGLGEQLTVFDLNGNPVWTTSIGEEISTLSWSPDSEILAVGTRWYVDYGRIILYDKKGVAKKTLGDLGAHVNIVKWSPSRLLLAAGVGSKLLIYNPETDETKTIGFRDTIIDLDWSPRGEIALLLAYEKALYGGKIILLDSDYEEKWSKEIKGVPVRISWSPNNRLLTYAIREKIQSLIANPLNDNCNCPSPLGDDEVCNYTCSIIESYKIPVEASETLAEKARVGLDALRYYCLGDHWGVLSVAIVGRDYWENIRDHSLRVLGELYNKVLFSSAPLIEEIIAGLKRLGITTKPLIEWIKENLSKTWSREQALGIKKRIEKIHSLLSELSDPKLKKLLSRVELAPENLQELEKTLETLHVISRGELLSLVKEAEEAVASIRGLLVEEPFEWTLKTLLEAPEKKDYVIGVLRRIVENKALIPYIKPSRRENSLVELARLLEKASETLRDPWRNISVKLAPDTVKGGYVLEICSRVSEPIELVELTGVRESFVSPIDYELPTTIPPGKCARIRVSVKPEPDGKAWVRVKIRLLGVLFEKKHVFQVKRPPYKPVEKPLSMQGFPRELLEYYEVLEYIGEGGFGRVWKAKRRKDNRVVAVKTPLYLDRETGRLFLREAGLWMTLVHENIVRLYDANIVPAPYLEIEYIDGVTIGDTRTRDLAGLKKPLSINTALRIIAGITRGLDYAHRKGILHLDLKPQNILLAQGLTAKITDWGLARIIEASPTTTTKTPLTLLYAAPEQIDPKLYHGVDERTDLYQLGTILYELLTGKPPHQEPSLTQTIASILYKQPQPPSKYNPQVPKTIDELVLKLLEKHKENRIQSTKELLRILEKTTRNLEETLENQATILKKTVEPSLLKRIAAENLVELTTLYISQGRLGKAIEKIIELETITGKTKTLETIKRQLDYMRKENITPEPETQETIRLKLIETTKKTLTR